MRPDPDIAVMGRPTVYPPSEDSYLLLAAVSVAPGERFLEVGTGSGLVAIHAARITDAVATDVNPDAVVLARDNARRNHVPLEVVRTDVMTGIRGSFDVVAFNPPYLPGPAADAFDRGWQGGAAGSDISMRFLRDLPRVLGPAGRAYLLLSGENAPARALADANFRGKVLISKPLFFERLEVLELRERLE